MGGWLDGIFGSNKDWTSSQTTAQGSSAQASQVGPDKWMTDAGKKEYTLASKSIPLSFKRYTGERVAGYGAGYGTGKSILAGMMGDSDNNYGEAKGRLNFLWDGTKGAMGKTAADYMSPYTENVLNPQLRKLDEARKLQLNEDNRAATMAGAFGDPQAGIARSLSNDRYNQTVADTTGKAYADAYDKGNALHEAELARLFQLPGMFSAIDRNKFDEDANLAKANTNFGLADQALRQKQDDVRYDDWQKKQGWRLQRAEALMKLLGLSPKNTIGVNTTTSQSTGTGFNQQPGSNDFMQLLGKVGGSALGGGFGDKLGSWLFG